MQSRLGLQELAQQITFSVYGLTGNPFRLQLSSILERHLKVGIAVVSNNSQPLHSVS
jgi:hypothetical protein